MNTIFAKINGFDEYVTLTLKNNFSVYKMPKFKIVVPRDGFELRKIEPSIEEPVSEGVENEEKPADTSAE